MFPFDTQLDFTSGTMRGLIPSGTTFDVHPPLPTTQAFTVVTDANSLVAGITVAVSLRFIDWQDVISSSWTSVGMITTPCGCNIATNTNGVISFQSSDVGQIYDYTNMMVLAYVASSLCAYQYSITIEPVTPVSSPTPIIPTLTTFDAATADQCASKVLPSQGNLRSNTFGTYGYPQRLVAVAMRKFIVDGSSARYDTGVTDTNTIVFTPSFWTTVSGNVMTLTSALSPTASPVGRVTVTAVLSDSFTGTTLVTGTAISAADGTYKILITSPLLTAASYTLTTSATLTDWHDWVLYVDTTTPYTNVNIPADMPASTIISIPSDYKSVVPVVVCSPLEYGSSTLHPPTPPMTYSWSTLYCTYTYAGARPFYHNITFGTNPLVTGSINVVSQGMMMPSVNFVDRSEVSISGKVMVAARPNMDLSTCPQLYAS